MTPTMQAFWIPGWHPTPLNKLLGHWAGAARHKKADAAQVKVASKAFGLYGAGLSHKRRVSMTIILPPGKRFCDPDAYWKSMLDAMVGCGLLHNDSSIWVVCDPVRFARAQDAAGAGTMVVLEDLP